MHEIVELGLKRPEASIHARRLRLTPEERGELMPKVRKALRDMKEVVLELGELRGRGASKPLEDRPRNVVVG